MVAESKAKVYQTHLKYTSSETNCFNRRTSPKVDLTDLHRDVNVTYKQDGVEPVF